MRDPAHRAVDATIAHARGAPPSPDTLDRQVLLTASSKAGPSVAPLLTPEEETRKNKAAVRFQTKIGNVSNYNKFHEHYLQRLLVLQFYDL